MFTNHTSLFVIASLLVLSCGTAAAQEFKEYPSSSRDAGGKIIRTGYITNAWYDNWVISAGGGISAVTAPGNTIFGYTFRLTDRLSLTLDLRAVSSLREPSSLTGTRTDASTGACSSRTSKPMIMQSTNQPPATEVDLLKA